jgi:C1A family cysteine protease
VDNICARLDANQPVVLIIKISERFYAPNGEGIVVGTPPDPDVGYHAVVAVGYGIADGERLILIRNSWGNSWGLNGYAWLVEDYLELRLRDVATMA